MRICMKYTFRLTENKARTGGWRCGRWSGATQKNKVHHMYIPASVPDMRLYSVLMSQRSPISSILFQMSKPTLKPNNATHSRAPRSRLTFIAWKPKKMRHQWVRLMAEGWLCLAERFLLARACSSHVSELHIVSLHIKNDFLANLQAP